mmetsp:Transcript_9555/g.16332  ORF Transcript_9555/g.16332 Transcript_9555/m.16332 type:complete len:345 (+) Transcript_9555:90-1124(+)
MLSFVTIGASIYVNHGRRRFYAFGRAPSAPSQNLHTRSLVRAEQTKPLPVEDDPEYIKVKVFSIGMSEKGYVVFLHPESSRHEGKMVPVFIGNAEAQSIIAAIHKTNAARPLTHDLMKNMMDSNGLVLSNVAVTEIRDDTFYGRLYIKKKVSGSNGHSAEKVASEGGEAHAAEAEESVHATAAEGETETIDLDSRPSDAIGLALRFNAGIYMHQKVYEMTSMTVKPKGERETVDERKYDVPEDPQVSELRTELQRAEQEERYSDVFRIREQLRDLMPEAKMAELRRELDLAANDERYDDCIKIQEEIKVLEETQDKRAKGRGRDQQVEAKPNPKIDEGGSQPLF